MEQFTRNCPKCGKEIIHKDKYSRNKAIKKQNLCRSCANNLWESKTYHIRYCPICNKEMKYDCKTTYEKAIKNNSMCKECRNKPENNYMFGKSVYEYWVNKYGKEVADKKTKEKNDKLSKPILEKMIAKYGKEIGRQKYQEFIKKQSKNNSGSNNSMFGKSVYEVWLEKYGEEIANHKLSECKSKQSKSSSGSNNPMFGRPTPKGAGSGWSGHYKGYYFRSLLELSYLKYLLDNDIKFDNAERVKYKIQYELDGKVRNYFPDYYLINTKEIVEIKPKKLINIKENKLKFQSAQIKYGNKFKIKTEEDIEVIDLKKLYQLYLSKELIFDKRYEQKFLDFYSKNVGEE